MGRQTLDSPVPRYSSTVALVSTIFACLKAVTAWPEEDSSTGRMSAAFFFTVSSVRSSFGQGDRERHAAAAFYSKCQFQHFVIRIHSVSPYGNAGLWSIRNREIKI